MQYDPWATDSAYRLLNKSLFSIIHSVFKKRDVFHTYCSTLSISGDENGFMETYRTWLGSVWKQVYKERHGQDTFVVSACPECSIGQGQSTYTKELWGLKKAVFRWAVNEHLVDVYAQLSDVWRWYTVPALNMAILYTKLSGRHTLATSAKRGWHKKRVVIFF